MIKVLTRIIEENKISQYIYKLQMSNYSHEYKEKLARKINKIKNKQHLIEILKIIKKDAISNEMMENNNGIFVMFHNLSDDTYNKIDKFFKKNTKITDSASECYSTEVESITPYSNDNYPYENQSRLKYSNHEKSIIKRKLYDEALIDISGETPIVNSQDPTDLNLN